MEPSIVKQLTWSQGSSSHQNRQATSPLPAVLQHISAVAEPSDNTFCKQCCSDVAVCRETHSSAHAHDKPNKWHQTRADILSNKSNPKLRPSKTCYRRHRCWRWQWVWCQQRNVPGREKLSLSGSSLCLVQWPLSLLAPLPTTAVILVVQTAIAAKYCICLSQRMMSLSQEHGLSGADSNSMLCMLCMLCCRIMPSLDQLAPEHEELGEIGCERDNLLAQG